MKKPILFLLSFFLFLTTKAQISDTPTLRQAINTFIVPNGNRAITGQILSNILHGQLNVTSQIAKDVNGLISSKATLPDGVTMQGTVTVSNGYVNIYDFYGNYQTQLLKFPDTSFLLSAAPLTYDRVDAVYFNPNTVKYGSVAGTEWQNPQKPVPAIPNGTYKIADIRRNVNGTNVIGLGPVTTFVSNDKTETITGYKLFDGGISSNNQTITIDKPINTFAPTGFYVDYQKAFGTQPQVDDPKAVSAKVIKIAKGRATNTGWAIYGPYETRLLPGDYVYEFRLRVSDNTNPGEVVFFDIAKGGVTWGEYYLHIKGTDFPDTINYKTFSVPFTITEKNTGIEFRVNNAIGPNPVEIYFDYGVAKPVAKGTGSSGPNFYSLDGELTGNRTIDGKGYKLQYSNLKALNQYARLPDGTQNAGMGISVDTTYGAQTNMYASNDNGNESALFGINKGSMRMSYSYYNKGVYNYLMLDTTGGFYASQNGKPFRYLADLSANYTARSMIDKGYLDKRLTELGYSTAPGAGAAPINQVLTAGNVVSQKMIFDNSGSIKLQALPGGTTYKRPLTTDNEGNVIFGDPIEPPALYSSQQAQLNEYFWVEPSTLSGHTIFLASNNGSDLFSLPEPYECPNKVITIKKIDAGDPIRINTLEFSWQTMQSEIKPIEGQNEILLNAQYSTITFFCDGSNWYVLSKI